MSISIKGVPAHLTHITAPLTVVDLINIRKYKYILNTQIVKANTGAMGFGTIIIGETGTVTVETGAVLVIAD